MNLLLWIDLATVICIVFCAGVIGNFLINALLDRDRIGQFLLPFVAVAGLAAMWTFFLAHEIERTVNGVHPHLSVPDNAGPDGILHPAVPERPPTGV